MDRLILEEKLEALRRCFARIEDRRAESAEILAGDIDRQDILSLNLTRAVQLCVDMALNILAATPQSPPRTMADSFELLADEGIITADLAQHMRRAVGFRNVAVHSYRRIDWNIVHSITHEGLEDFRRFASSVSQILNEAV